jgi:hypothetical protein
MSPFGTNVADIALTESQRDQVPVISPKGSLVSLGSVVATKMRAEVAPDLKTDIWIRIVAEILATVVIQWTGGKFVETPVFALHWRRSRRHGRLVPGIIVPLGRAGGRGGDNCKSGDESRQFD